MANILIIDDDKVLCEMICRHLGDMGHNVVYAVTLKEGLRKVISEAFDVVFLDVYLPDGNGLEALPKIMEVPSTPEVIIFTGKGDPDGAELAIKSGAWDYIEKPPSIEQMTLPLVRALQYRDEKKKRKSRMALKREGILGISTQLEECLDLVARAANSDANVLITGETGTGKELFARAIHNNSPRSHKRLVVVDCAALPDSLVESMLFGNEKGAFTGADRAREGLVKQADGGTLFLDEVGELPVSIQKAFLRILQERRFRPLGGKREIKSDFRLVLATNRNLKELVRKGEFREELLFRLQTITIDLPPLRERPADIREITRSHAAKICSLSGKPEKCFSDGFFQVLENYQWPGNVRELINTIEKVITEIYDEPTLFERHLPTHMRVQAARMKMGKKSQLDLIQPESSQVRKRPPKIRDFLDTMRAEYLKELMSYADGKVNNACKIAGVSRARLYQLLNKYKISSSS